MRKIILVMMTVLICAAYGYAESCSSGQGSLSYQISGCGEQRRACCTATSTTNSRNCSGNVSGACAGTQTRTRTVAGTCGSCSYGSWSNSGCSYTQSCAQRYTATEVIDFKDSPQYANYQNVIAQQGNTFNSMNLYCGGKVQVQKEYTLTSSCGSCSYNSGTIQNYNYGPTLRTVSCSDKKRETMNCTSLKNYMPYDSGRYSNFCSGTASASFKLEDNCGSCTYRLNSWDGTCTCCSYIWRTYSGRYSTLAECNSQRSYIMNNAMTQYTTGTSCNSYSTHGKYKTGSVTACSAIGNGYGFSYQRCTCSDF